MEDTSSEEVPEHFTPFQLVHIKSEPMDNEYYSEQEEHPESYEFASVKIKQEREEALPGDMVSEEASPDDMVSEEASPAQMVIVHSEEEDVADPIYYSNDLAEEEKQLAQLTTKQLAHLEKSKKSAKQRNSAPKRKRKPKPGKPDAGPSAKRKRTPKHEEVGEDAGNELFPLQLVSVQMEHSEDEDVPVGALYPDVNMKVEADDEGIASHSVVPKHVQIPVPKVPKKRIRKKPVKADAASSTKPSGKGRPKNVKPLKTSEGTEKKIAVPNPRTFLQHQCFFCAQQFQVREEMLLHLTQVHPENKLRCEHCEYKDWFKYSLLHHITSVHFPSKVLHQISPAPAPLGFIIKSDTDGVQRVYQYKVKAPMQIFMCLPCQKTFNAKSDLDYHNKSIHLNIRDFACTICPKAFVTRNNLKQHYENAHSDVRPFQCEKCSSQFKTKSNLVKHNIMHEDVYEFQCKLCARNFKRKSCLNSHMMQVHSQVRNFGCETCGKKFKTRCKLSAHQVVHSDLCPFICEQCGSRFKRKHALDVHIKQVHGKKK